MKDYLSENIRNVVLLGQAGSGKSTFLEATLFFTGKLDRMGSAQDGTLESDYDPEEAKRNQSVYTSLIPIEWNNCKINFIDTPGSLDFEGEKVAGYSVGDNCLVFVSAKDGVESQTENAVKMIKKSKPTIFFINKMDDPNASFEKVYNELREKFGKQLIAFEYPIIKDKKMIGSINVLSGKTWYYDDLSTPKEVPAEYADIIEGLYNDIAEAIAMSDDELMDRFFNGEKFSEEEINKGLSLGVRSGEICPVYCGSSTEIKGIRRMLDLIVENFPTYKEKGEVMDANGFIYKTNEDEKMSAQIFKTIVDPFVGKISYLKVMSGVLKMDSTVYNANQEQEEKVGQIYCVQGKNQIAVGKLFTGDIGAVVKLQYTNTSDTLCDLGQNIKYEPIDFPEGLLGLAVSPKTKADEDKMSESLKRILQEDKTLRFEKNKETSEQILYGLGDQQIDVVLNKLKNKYKVEITTKTPKVQYRETIKAKVEVQGKHKKQSGGAGQYGDVWIRFEPADTEEMIFDEEVFGGAVPKQYFPAVEAGLREAMQHGPLAGYKVVGVKATLYDGSYHPVDSKEIAFKSAARLAYKAGMPKAKPQLLEPISKVKVYVPEEYTGTIIGDLNKRRGLVMGMEMVDGIQVIDAEVPSSEMQKYAIELRALSQGRGKYSITFDHYDVAPANVAEKVIKESNFKDDTEE